VKAFRIGLFLCAPALLLCGPRAAHAQWTITNWSAVGTKPVNGAGWAASATALSGSATSSSNTSKPSLSVTWSANLTWTGPQNPPPPSPQVKFTGTITGVLGATGAADSSDVINTAPAPHSNRNTGNYNPPPFVYGFAVYNVSPSIEMEVDASAQGATANDSTATTATATGTYAVQ